MADSDPKRPERLDKAPIIEALIDIHVEPPLARLEDLDPFDDFARGEFPERKRVVEWQGNVDLSDDEPKVTAPRTEVKGSAFWAADKRRVMQARLNGFSFSHLAPYDSWSALRNDARGWWNKFCGVTKPTEVKRYAVRFINRLELPLPMSDFGDYLRTSPRVADGLPQSLSSVFMRLVVPFHDATVIITQAIDEAGVTVDKIPVILDIEVFQTASVPCDGDELWQSLETLRRIKNDVFFSSLTPTAWRLFE
jgi:uncharacterized protein (TIGR04255 family)